tara:strand:- start:1922 stop:3124 length:1203 start_codon:yes stop_codon:yes gene_type:complete
LYLANKDHSTYNNHRESLNMDTPTNMSYTSTVAGFDPNYSSSNDMGLHHDYQQQAEPHGAGPYADGHHSAENYAGMETSSDMAFGDADAGPSLVPAPSSHRQNLTDTYISSYSNPETPHSTRMEHAKTFAVFLLQRYFPEHEGYIVQPSLLGPIARLGINFMLKAKDGIDPDYTPLPPKKYKKKDKKSLKSQRDAEYLRQFAHYWPFSTNVAWHMIEPENIAGFDVLKRNAPVDDSSDEEAEYRIHTCMAIVIDDMHSFPLFAATNDVHRGDILTDALCRGQQIQSGHAILLFGSRLELYDFENGQETKFGHIEDGEDSDEMEVHTKEPAVSLSKDATGNELAVDLRASDLHTIDYMFRTVAAREVVYIESGQEHEADHSEEPAHDGHEQVDVMAGNVGD